MSARTNSGRDAYGETSHGPPSRQGRGRGWRRGSATVVDSKVRASKPNAPRPSARDVSTSQRRMDLMASVSRSSGLEKDGDECVLRGLSGLACVNLSALQPEKQWHPRGIQNLHPRKGYSYALYTVYTVLNTTPDQRRHGNVHSTRLGI